VSNQNNFKELKNENSFVKYLSFYKSFGCQDVIKPDIDYAIGDCAVSMNADLQHPPDIIHEMVEK
jgi:hypothetical protein